MARNSLILLLAIIIRSVAAFRIMSSTSTAAASALRARACFPSIIRQILSPRVLYSSSSDSTNNVDASSPLANGALVNLAKQFIANKNLAGSGQSSLDGVFDMCSSSVDLYGLKDNEGEEEVVRPGFISFFKKHEGLQHELMEDPSVVGEGVVQYPFVKRWNDKDEALIWKSIDAAKPRNKVERLWFDGEGKLEKVSVVEVDAPLD